MLKYYGDQVDDHNLSTNDRVLSSNWADTRVTSGYPDVPLVPLSYRRVKLSFTSQSTIRDNYYWGSYSDSSLITAPSMSQTANTDLLTPLLNNARISAIANLNNSMRGSQFSLGVTMLEGRKTINFIALSAKRIIDAYKLVRKGRFAKAADVLSMPKISSRQKRRMRSQLRRGTQGFTDNWLAYRYGVRPLVFDVYNSIDAYHTLALSNLDDIRYKGFSRKQLSSISGFATNEIRARSNFNISAACTDRTNLAVSTLGLDNPLLIAWELIPFSFIFDWFVPVGTWLEAMKTPSGFLYNNGSEGTWYKHSGNYFQPASTSGSLSGYYYSETGPKTAVYDREDFQRTVLSDFPSPSGPPSVEALSNALNLSKAIDAVSILTNLSTKRR